MGGWMMKGINNAKELGWMLARLKDAQGEQTQVRAHSLRNITSSLAHFQLLYCLLTYKIGP